MRNKKPNGFTFIEIIISVLILSVMFVMTARLGLEIADGWGFGTKRSEMAESAVIALDRMVREIRMVKDSSSVLAADSSTFQFIDVNDNTITFSRAGNQLLRTMNGVSNILADNVSLLSFVYYNSAGVVIAAPALSPSTDIRRVAVDLVFSLGGTQVSLESGSYLRRL